MFRERLAPYDDRIALASAEACHSYRELLAEIDTWTARLRAAGATAKVALLTGGYDLPFVGALLALWELGCVAVPLSHDPGVSLEYAAETSRANLRVDSLGTQVLLLPDAATHPLYDDLFARGRPGLVLFTSGSTGRAKAAVHDVTELMRRYQQPRGAYCTLAFLQLDHIGGLNTLLFTLANGGTVVPAGQDRSPGTICRLIAQRRVELLPTSPTFLNLLLMSGAHRQHDLSSLRRITYGTEPMPQGTLDRLRAELPGVVLQQTYGMTELGILSSKSRGNDSLWVRLGGEGYELRVVDGRLWVRAQTAMRGYLNAESPFDSDGYLDTGDIVEQDGEWLRILGRASEIINVGGHKVYPAEVESVLLSMPGVLDATVMRARHPLTGQVVKARVRLEGQESKSEFRARLGAHCRDKLPRHAIPVQLEFVTDVLHNSRFKRMRNPGDEEPEP